MAAITEAFHGYNAVRIGNGRGAEALVSIKGARPMAFWPKGQSSGSSLLFTNPDKPYRSTHVCWPNFSRLSLKGDGADSCLDESGKPVKGGLYGQYSLAKYGYGDKVRTLRIHGPSKDEEWNVEKHDQDKVVLSYEHKADEVTFPFDVRLTASALIDESGVFSYAVNATSLDHVPVPMDLAIHTYLPWEKEMRISGMAGIKFFEGTDWQRIVPAPMEGPEMHLDKLTALEKHCLLPDALPPFIITYPESKQTAMYSFMGFPKEMVLWANSDEGNFLCMEPVLRGRNCLNGTNALLLEPGRTGGIGFSMEMKE